MSSSSCVGCASPRTSSRYVPSGCFVKIGLLTRFEADGQQLSCGDRVTFEFAPLSGAACASDASFFDVRIGEAVIESEDDFETDQGWQHDAVNSTATTGAWVRGDPDATAYQPGDDFSPNGTQAWFTATNASC